MAGEYTTANHVNLQTTFILRRFLETLEPALQFYKLATPGELPDGAGNTARWLHFEKLTINTTPLSEIGGTDNQLSSQTISGVEASIQEYGQWQKIGERSRRTMVTGGMEAIASRFAFAGAETIDTLLFNEAKSTGHYYIPYNTTVDSNTQPLSVSGTAKAADLNTIKAYLDNTGNHGGA